MMPPSPPQPMGATGRIPALLQDGATIEQRVMDLMAPLTTHFNNIRLLSRYSKQRAQNWFPGASVSASSVVLSHIRAVEKTAIAYLAGGKPNWRVASYGGYAGSAQQDAQRGDRDAKFERLARAIWHHIDRQSEHSLAYEPVERAIRQGEIVLQFGWIAERDRLIGGPGGQPLGAASGPEGLPMPFDQPFSDAPENTAADVAGHASPDRHRFPVFIRVLNRLKVFYELDPYGEPVEVYHKYRAKASQVAELYPDWREDAQGRLPNDDVEVVEAYVGAFWCVVVDGRTIFAPRPHHYGPRPPFVIQQCAPEDVSQDDLGVISGPVEVRAGIPFCYDMLNPFREACISASLERAILENAALGQLVIENADASRFDGEQDNGNDALVIGPATALFLKNGEKLVKPPVADLPAPLAAYLQQSHEGMEILGFSRKLLAGDTPGDSSGFAVEQVRQAAMARLLPYRDGIARAWSRVFEKIFVLFSVNWPAEWGEQEGAQVNLTGQRDGAFFSETMSQQDLTPPPDTIEMTLLPAVPQNKIAEEAARNASVQAGTMDILVALEERGSPDPQDELDSILLHTEQRENPAVRGPAVMAIIEKRAKKAGVALPPPMAPLAPPGGPQGAPQAPQGPQAPPVAPGPTPQPPSGIPAMRPPLPFPQRGGPPPQQPNPGPRLLGNDPRAIRPAGRPLPPGPRAPGARGPLPQQRPAGAPLGVPGSPAPPIPFQRKGRP